MADMGDPYADVVARQVQQMSKVVQGLVQRVGVLEKRLEELPEVRVDKRLARMEVRLEHIDVEAVRMSDDAIRAYVVGAVRVEVKKGGEL